MIDTRSARRFCRDDIIKVENYDKAIADTTQTWHLHHRDEVRILPSGMVARRSREELIENWRYYSCPANELIFLTSSDHKKLHSRNGNNPFLGMRHTEETLRKMSEAKKGKNNPFYGRHISEEHRRKLSEVAKTRWARQRDD